MIASKERLAAKTKGELIYFTNNSGKLKQLAVDHCKITKKIRGLLCQKCNQGIGQFLHNPKFLKSAAIYCEQSI